MVALASVADVEALGANAVTAEMLESASARFRSEAKHAITRATYTQVLHPSGGLVTLPIGPVLSLTSVSALEVDGTPGAALAGWTFDGIDTINVGSLLGVSINSPRLAGNVSVVYEAGYDEVPEDVRWAVAAMVKRAAEAGSAGVTSEAIGDFSRSFGGYTASGSFSMTRDELAVAKSYRPAARSINVGRV